MSASANAVGDVRNKPSILIQVTGLAIAAILTAQIVSVIVVATTPPPAAPRMTLAEAREALLSEASASRSGLRRSLQMSSAVSDTPGNLTMFAQALALSLDAAPEDVRLSSGPGSRLGPPSDDRALVVVTPPDGGTPSVFLERPSAGPALDPQTYRAIMDSDFSLPASEVAWRQGDGRWIVVGPTVPLTADWRFRLFASFALSLAIVGPIAWLAARHLTRPIRLLADAARNTTLGAPAMPVIGGAREIQEAARSMAEMTRRLAHDAEQRTAMLVAIAHDLRTPLTSLRLRTETLAEADRTIMARQIRRMDAMVSGVLTYARARQSEPPRRVDLWSIVDEALALTEQTQAVRILGDRTDLAVTLPPSALLRAITNLVNNAQRYASDVELEVQSAPQTVQIHVRDRGPGIPTDQMERVRKPFERVEVSRNPQTGGLGLGLAIVSDLAAACGGTLQLDNRVGGGLRATLDLPRHLSV